MGKGWQREGGDTNLFCPGRWTIVYYLFPDSVLVGGLD